MDREIKRATEREDREGQEMKENGNANEMIETERKEKNRKENDNKENNIKEEEAWRTRKQNHQIRKRKQKENIIEHWKRKRNENKKKRQQESTRAPCDWTKIKRK